MSDSKQTAPAPKKKPVRTAAPKRKSGQAGKSRVAKAAPAARVAGQPIKGADFKRTVRAGLGTAGERLFTGLAWFNGALYLATSARAPEGVARIHRRLPGGEWTTVYESPPQPLGDGSRISRDYAISMLKVLQAPDDKAPCLYAGTASILGGQILRSEDGESFERASTHGLSDDTQLSVAELVGFGKNLFAVPRGTITDAVHEARWSPEPMIYMATPGKKGEDGEAETEWVPACLPGFGDLTNLEVATLTEANGALYASTINPSHGFQLWRTEAKGKPPFKWEKVLDRGAWRYALNMEVTSACAFGDALYLGTGLSGRGHDATHDIGPGAAELIRVRSDGSWDLLVGEMRFSPDGLLVPSTAMGPGFHNDFNAAISTLFSQDGVLYAGTQNWEPDFVLDQRVPEGESPPPLEGGAELWASSDGSAWTRIEDGTLADPAAIGVTHMAGDDTAIALTLDLSGRAVARKANLWTGIGLVDVPPDDETDVLVGGEVVPEPPPALSLDPDQDGKKDEA